MFDSPECPSQACKQHGQYTVQLSIVHQQSEDKSPTALNHNSMPYHAHVVMLPVAMQDSSMRTSELQDALAMQIAAQGAECDSQGTVAVSTLSSSIVRLHLEAVNAVVLAGVDSTQWHSSRKPLTWPDAPG